ncbi:MAG: hypothetical protein BroJett024_12890 [Alphaproteobacteria bacterium]|nr:MAG: hypothetical protein BroJett024_12890 [Alphaproteobacteria bacterium]
MTPPPLITAAILAGGGVPLLLAALGYCGARLRQPWMRYRTSVALAGLGWLLAGIVLARHGYPASVFDWIAGLAIFVAASLAAFVIWSVLAWGFSLHMLLGLAQARAPLTVEEWAAQHAGRNSFRAIALDRLAILLRLSLVRRNGEEVELVPGRGRIAAALVVLARRIFALP